MKDMNYFTILELENSPILKTLLIEFVKTNYEEKAIYDDEHLLMEYNYLAKHNKLNLLFENEMMNNYFSKMQSNTLANPLL